MRIRWCLRLRQRVMGGKANFVFGRCGLCYLDVCFSKLVLSGGWKVKVSSILCLE